MKPLSQINPEDFEALPVWQFETQMSGDEPCLSPVKAIPVADLRNRIVGVKVSLHNDMPFRAILGNIQLLNARATQHFLTLSIEKGGKWFDLARYHDVDYSRRGPAELARFLGLPIKEVFPIRYDVSRIAEGHPDVVAGKIHAEPKEVLPESELIELALE